MSKPTIVLVHGAFVPDRGESITDLQTRFPSHVMGDNFLQPRPS